MREGYSTCSPSARMRNEGYCSCPVCIYVCMYAGADLEHNLGGGQEHARGTGRASGERCGKVSSSPCEARKL